MGERGPSGSSAAVLTHLLSDLCPDSDLESDGDENSQGRRPLGHLLYIGGGR